MSNGLEYKVALHFQEKFLKGELHSVVNGMEQKKDPKRNLLVNSKVNCEKFVEGKASDFLLKKEKHKTGDLQIIISNAFYYKGAYYVHA